MPYSYHKYLIYTNNNNQQYVAEVKPQAASENDGQLPEDIRDPFVVLKTQLGIGENPYGTMIMNDPNKVYSPENPLSVHSYPSNQRETITTGDNLTSVWEKVKNEMAKFDGNTPYLPATQNSNWAVDEALKTAGLPLPQQDGFNSEWVPSTHLPIEHPGYLSPGSVDDPFGRDTLDVVELIGAIGKNIVGDFIESTGLIDAIDALDNYQEWQNHLNELIDDSSLLEALEQGGTALLDHLTDLLGGLLDFLIPPAYGDDINPLTGESFTAAQNFIQKSDPLTLDLDGDGIETVPPSSTNPILFDHDGDGVKSGTGWIKPDDGFLVLDRNGNGSIDDGSELFGDSTPVLDAAGSMTGKAVDGFDALSQQDSNADGVVDSSDANWNNLRVWQDLNQDGISQANELKTLDELGIAGINVGKTEHSKVLPGGNEIADLGTYTRTDGTTGGTGSASGLADVNLADDTFHRVFTDRLDTSAVANLPDMQGSGAVRDLREAASQSPELAATLAQLGPNTTREQLKAAIGVILQQWADSANFSDSFETADAQHKDLFFIPPGATALDAYNARYAGPLGAYSGIDNGSPSGLSLTNDIQAKFDNIRSQQDSIERLLKTLEAFNGRDFAPIATNSGSTTLVAFSTSAPAGSSGSGFGLGIDTPVMYNMQQARLNLLTQSYNSLVSSVYDALILQTRLKPYLDSVSLTITDGGIGLDFSALDGMLAAQHTVNANVAVGDLLELRRLMGDKLESAGWDGLALLADWAVTDALDPAVLGTLAEFGYSGGIHTDAAGQVYGGNANDIVAGQAYDPATDIVRISAYLFMQARTGLPENGGQHSKQAANDKKWRIAA